LFINSLKEVRPTHFDKLVTGRFLVERMLPETALHLARIRRGAGNVMGLPAEAF
jgi:acyl-CoA dehydrogenase